VIKFIKYSFDFTCNFPLGNKHIVLDDDSYNEATQDLIWSFSSCFKKTMDIYICVDDASRFNTTKCITIYLN